ncbi:hypothetical protein FACS1894132_13970 [Clostridia bacterium]|nr:hypothetical protein FACS1894132_13970 [Clostridia bacterium]
MTAIINNYTFTRLDADDIAFIYRMQEEVEEISEVFEEVSGKVWPDFWNRLSDELSNKFSWVLDLILKKALKASKRGMTANEMAITFCIPLEKIEHLLDEIKQQETTELNKQLTKIIANKNIPHVIFDRDESGNAFIDKEKHPKLYDWAVNG